MAKNRMVNTRFWNDSFISQLDPIEKLLFIYFLTNEHTNICGIYELPLKIAAIETGIDASMFEKIFPRLVNKIVYIDGWVCIRNFPKYQASGQPTVQKGVETALEAIPRPIIEKAIAYGYPIHSPAKYLNLNSNLNSNLKGVAVAPPEISFEEWMGEQKELERREVPSDSDGADISMVWAKVDGKPLTRTEISSKKALWRKETHQEDPSTANHPIFVVAPLFKGLNRAWDTWYKVDAQRNAAESLLGENFGLELAKKALAFYANHQHEEFCPQIDSPHALVNKWAKLQTFRDKKKNK